ncbi:phosphotransferase family protein [Marinicaulis aureus]|uniref:Phosphotransferase family protein n=1 Tax=Hyphococcus aureus TaxID=2666033 RepID=A0ABW1KYD5_9PROT
MAEKTHITSIDENTAYWYLINMADTLHHEVTPELKGAAKERAEQLSLMMTRLATRLVFPSEDSGPHLDALEGGLDKESINHDGAILDAEQAVVDELMASIAGKAGPQAREADPARIEVYLKSIEAGGPATKVTAAKLLAGGRSKATFKVSQSGARDLPDDLIIRQDWAGSVTGATVVSEYEMLRKLHAHGVKAPQPFALETGSDALGAPFMIVAAVRGACIGGIFDPPRDEALALQAAEQMAAFHRISCAEFEACEGLIERSYTAEQLSAELDAIEGIVKSLEGENVTLHAAFDWLWRHIADVKGPRVLVHGDLGFHNFLVEGGTLSAVLDWEFAHLGNPAEDLGYVRSWAEQMTDWETFLRAYREAGGLKTDKTSVDFFTLWSGLRIYHFLMQARAGITSGKVRDPELTHISLELAPMLAHRISRELRRIVSDE